MPTITELYYDAFAGKALNEASLDFIHGLIDSEDLPTQIMAVSIILLSGTKLPRAECIGRLLAICERTRTDQDSKSAALLLLIIEVIPNLKNGKAEVFSSYAYEAASSPFTPVRINALRVLMRMGRGGDSKAVQLLKAATRDSEATVRESAARFVQDLAK